MWRNWVPVVNPAQGEEDDNYESPEEELDPGNLVSPNRPHQSPSASPRALLRPDPPPVEEVLAGVQQQLRNLPNRQQRADNRNAHRQAIEAAAIAAAAMPAPVVNFEDENGVDDDGSMKDACSRVDKLNWDMNDLKFVFSTFEIRVKAAGVKKQYTKFQVLCNILPVQIQNEVKSMLIKQETEFPQNNAYKLLKTQILRIFGPKANAAIDRALTRVLVDKPSSLARALVNDICKKELDCTCCPSVVLALWQRQLSSAVRAGIAHCTFNKQNFEQIVQLADDIHASQPGVAARQVAAVSLDETQPAIPYGVPEVAAVSRGGRGGRGGRGRGRGNRGNRGGGQSGGGGQSNGGNQSGGNSQSNQPKHKGTKHPDLPEGEWRGCSMHFRFGRQAHFCNEPGTCPWKNVFTPKPEK